jgi:transcriptional regulator with XRE-family HTH domain
MTINVVVRATGLKRRRNEVGLTQRELARQVSVTQNYIAAIEADDRRAGPELRRKLMQALDAKFEDLFEILMIDEEKGSEVELVPDQSTRRRTG